MIATQTGAGVRAKFINRSGMNLAKATKTNAGMKPLSPRAKRVLRAAEAEANAQGLGADRRFTAIMLRAESRERRAGLLEKWTPWEGTPETNERIAVIPSRRRQSAVFRMVALGKLSLDDAASATEIAQIVEMIESPVSVRSASLEARVDQSGSARDAVVESLNRIRAERAYTEWRESLPHPRRMIIDMIVKDAGYVQLARAHKMNWRRARRALITALRAWPGFKMAAHRTIGEDDVHEAYNRLGEGTLLAPKPKADLPPINDDEAR
jgi:hypothetical protein